jgi:hypothetical protein
MLAAAFQPERFTQLLPRSGWNALDAQQHDGHRRPSITRLLFLVGYAMRSKAWQPETVPVAEAADLIR